MLFAMSQIVFFLLLASLLGGVAGWWLARSGLISVTAAMDRSGAHTAADRELESARAEIDRLQAKLAITTEAIRELETGEVATDAETPSMSEFAEPAPLVEFARAIPAVPGAPVELRAVESHDEAEEPEASAAQDPPADGAIDVDDADGVNEPVVRSVRDKGGKRLSDRVAEASTLSRPDRDEPTIKFDDADG